MHLQLSRYLAKALLTAVRYAVEQRGKVRRPNMRRVRRFLAGMLLSVLLSIGYQMVYETLTAHSAVQMQQPAVSGRVAQY